LQYIEPEKNAIMELTIDKKRIQKAINELPEDATIEDALYELYVLHQVSKSLKDVDQGRTLSHEEMKQEFLK
jgi:tRNA threonylcarbamoyladenosine modification (KEOPS) complex Cgi121 subunit